MKTKSKNNLESLRRLLSVLRREEMILLKDFLHPKKTASVPKTLQLLNSALDPGLKTQCEVKQVVSPHTTQAAFCNLIGELKKKIYHSLILETNLSRKGVYPLFVQVEYECKKQLLAAKIIVRRGLQTEYLGLLDKVIATAKTFEVFEVLVEALLLRYKAIGIRHGTAQNQRKEIEHFQACKAAIDLAQLHYAEITANETFNANTEASQFLIRQQEKLSQKLNLFYSDTLFYWVNICSVYFLQKKQLFEQAGDVLSQVLVKIYQSDAIRMSRRIGELHLRIADNCFFMTQFDKMIEHADLGLELYNQEHFNHHLLLEYKFLAYFMKGNYGEAHKVIRKLSAIDYRKISPFYSSKWKYYHSCVLLFRGLYGPAQKQLGLTTKLDDDKDGWNIAVRILDIIIQISSNELGDSADKKINNLLVFIPGYRDKISKRDLLIIDVIRQLKKTGYDFNKVRHICAQELLTLSSGISPYKWQITSPELIRFDAWFMAKVKKMEYRYDLVVS